MATENDQRQELLTTCLQCRVCKLYQPISKDENARFIRSTNNYWIACIERNGRTHVTQIINHQRSKTGTEDQKHCFSDVSSVTWKKDENNDNLYILDYQKNILEYSLQGSTPQLAAQWTFDQIKTELTKKVPEISSVESMVLVECLSETCLLLVNHRVFVSLGLEETGNCEHVASVEFPEPDNCPSYQIISQHLVVLSVKAETLYMFDFVTGHLWGQIDLQFSKLDLSNIMQWRLSHDFINLFVIGQDWMLHTLVLDSYVESYPKSLRGKQTLFHPYRDQMYLTNHATCRHGDSRWREKLMTLHQKQYLIHKDQTQTNTKSARQKTGKRRVTGFKSDKVLSEFSEDRAVVDSRELPDDLHQFVIFDMAVGRFSLTLALERTSGEKAICVVDVSHHKIFFKSISTTQKILLSTSLSQAHLVVSDVYVFHVFTEVAVEQEDLVSKLMLYGGASAADKLCDFNKWGRCTVPLHTLQIGIQHRQLDTVAFFLKSKENLFTSSKQKPSLSPSTSMEEALLWESRFSHLDNVRQLESALTLLVQAVKENLTDQQSRDFANKLLTLTLEFLYALVHNGLSLYQSLCQSDERSEVEKGVDILMGHIARLRQCLTPNEPIEKKLTWNRLEDVDVPDGNVKVMDWSEFIAEEAVEAATIKNELPLLQTHLLKRGQPQVARYDRLVAQGMDQVLHHLNNRDMATAKQILSNMGLEPISKLWDLAKQVKVRDLQMFIVEDLQSSGSLSPEQISHVTFLSALYQLYPCSSFSHAMLAKTAEQNSDWSEENVLATLLTKTSHEVNSMCGDIGSGSSLDGKDGPYSEVILDWLTAWDSEIRERILLEGHIMKDDFIIEMYSNRKLLWRYLLSHNRHDDALTLLDLMIREVNEDGSSAKQRQDCVADLYNDLDLCAHFLQLEICHKLMRKGFISPEMLSDFPLLLGHLCQIGGVLTSPHPLHHMDRHTLQAFHTHFLAYCAQHKLVLPLWMYCRQHRLTLDHLGVDSQSIKTWLVSLQWFFNIPRTPEDTGAILQASLASAAHIWNITEPSLAELIQEGHVMAAIATLPYSQTPIHQMTGEDLSMDLFAGLDQSVLEEKLSEFPKLFSALFPTGNIDSPRLDVSIYQLLVGSARLDPRRLFGWQEGNCVAGEECQRSLPYFSQPELVSKFAYTEKIRYPFYLKHGRPTYAFLSFLAEEVDSGATTISRKRIYTVCGVALWIAVKHFTNPVITSACVAFVEMAGQDSLLLRSYIQAGSDILAYKNLGIMGNVDKRREKIQANEDAVVDVLQSCVRQRRRHGPRFIELLERATHDAIARKGITSTSFEAAQHWLLTMTLCHQLQLPLSTGFLEECARSDSWLPFLWFAQLHQFPKQQLQGFLHQFRSRHLRDHLHYVIENADAKSIRKLSQSESQTRTKDVRSSLYAKIGLPKERLTDEMSSEEEEEQRIMNSPPGTGLTFSRDQSVEMTLTEDSAPEDVFQVVFRSQSSPSPWKSLLQAAVILRNSLFAELAACHQDASVAACLCGWLVAMMDRTEHAQFLVNHGKSVSSWSMAELERLIDVYLYHHWEYTLATGYDIFQMNSPLLPFLKFLAELSQRRNYAACTSLLGDFKEAMTNFGQGKKSEYLQQPVLGNSHWVEQTANRLLNQQLLRTGSLYEALQFIKLLDEENIALVFSFDVPDYTRLHKLVQILQKHSLSTVSVPAFIREDMSASESRKAVSLLIEKKCFVDAYKFAHLTNISCDDIALAEMAAEKNTLKETLVWRSRVARFRFWKMCAGKFRLNHVATSKVTDFFKDEAESIADMLEKARVFELSLELVPIGTEVYNDIYRLMWNCRIQAKMSELKGEVVESVEPVEEILSVLEVEEGKKMSEDKSDILSFDVVSRKRTSPQYSPEEKEALDILIGQLLDEGRVRESLHVIRTFAHYSQDLAIIMTCIGLSEGKVNRESMEPDMRRLLTLDTRSRSSVGSFPGFTRTTSSISLSSIVPTWEFLPAEKEDAIVVMERLLGHCKHGQQCCLRIITAYKTACVLSSEYVDVVQDKEFSVLDELLKTSYPQRFMLARDYLSTSSLSDSQVASFLSVSIIKALNVFIGGNPGSRGGSTKDLMFNPTEGSSMFSQFIKLCQDPSLLGANLLEAVSAMGDNSEEQPTRQTLSIQTELLIMAHECHTVACSMEGISHVLRSARIITDSLARAEEFPLMIRLLTGVGRFSEMTYIFDALKLNHQFELLLKKGMEREDNLKTAVLDYLKRFHPEDKDSYTMVALKFTMYREIAHMLEDNGRKNLRSVKDKPLENTREIQDTLKQSAQYFSDAAESYVKDNCLRHAQQCLRQARLLALQLQHLASGIQVINLTPEGVTALISQHPKFIESLIVSEAYGKRASWSDAIYHNVILGGDFRYLQDLKSHIHLNTNTIHDAITRFQQSPSPASTNALSNIKKLLPLCKDICLQYRIAKELQLNDVTTNMMRSDAGSYLHDMMAMS